MKKRLREAYSDYLSGKSDVTQVDRRLQSYLGILSHANQHALTQAVKNAYWVRNESKISKGQGTKSNASTKVSITNGLALPQDTPDAVAAAAEVVVVDGDAIGRETPNN